MIKIITCSCESKYQDKRYGKGKRVANITTKDRGRYTICGKES